MFCDHSVTLVHEFIWSMLTFQFENMKNCLKGHIYKSFLQYFCKKLFDHVEMGLIISFLLLFISDLHWIYKHKKGNHEMNLPLINPSRAWSLDIPLVSRRGQAHSLEFLCSIFSGAGNGDLMGSSKSWSFIGWLTDSTNSIEFDWSIHGSKTIN